MAATLTQTIADYLIENPEAGAADTAKALNETLGKVKLVWSRALKIAEDEILRREHEAEIKAKAAAKKARPKAAQPPASEVVPYKTAPERIKDFLIEHPDASMEEIATGAACSVSTVKKHLKAAQAVLEAIREQEAAAQAAIRKAQSAKSKRKARPVHVEPEPEPDEDEDDPDEPEQDFAMAKKQAAFSSNANAARREDADLAVTESVKSQLAETVPAEERRPEPPSQAQAESSEPEADDARARLMREAKAQEERQAAEAETDAAPRRGFGGFLAGVRKAKAAKPQVQAGKPKAQGKTVNPYLDPRTKYRDRFRTLSSINLWLKIWACVSALLVLGAFGFAIELANRTQFVPYVMTVDSHGVAVGTGLATPITEVPQKVAVAALTAYISNLRTVTVDVEYLRDQSQNVLAMTETKDPAYQKIVDWLTGEDPDTGGKSPYDRAAEEIVHLKFTGALQLTASTMQIDWIETTRGRDGQKLKPATPMRAVVTWRKGPPSQEIDFLSRNPYGIYVQDFSWNVVKTN